MLTKWNARSSTNVLQADTRILVSAFFYFLSFQTGKT